MGLSCNPQNRMSYWVDGTVGRMAPPRVNMTFMTGETQGAIEGENVFKKMRYMPTKNSALSSWGFQDLLFASYCGISLSRKGKST